MSQSGIQQCRMMFSPFERELRYSLKSSLIFQVYDYVKAYLGDSRETREFAREFIERRKKQTVKTPASVSTFPQVSIKTPSESRCVKNQCERSGLFFCFVFFRVKVFPFPKRIQNCELVLKR